MFLNIYFTFLTCSTFMVYSFVHQRQEEVLISQKSAEMELIIEFTNNQTHVSLDQPSTLFYEGKQKQCFGKLRYQEIGIFSAQSQIDSELLGVLSIPIFINSLNSSSFHIYFRLNHFSSLVAVALNLLNKEIIIQDDFQISNGILTNGWQEVQFTADFYAFVFMNTAMPRKIKIDFRWGQRLQNGIYRIGELVNFGLFIGQRPREPTETMATNRHPTAWTTETVDWMEYIVTKVFDNVYTIKSNDWQAAGQALGCMGDSPTNGWIFSGPYNPYDARFLWVLTQDIWGRYSIKCWFVDLYWSNDSDASQGKVIVLRPLIDNLSQKFFFYWGGWNFQPLQISLLEGQIVMQY